MNEEYYVTSTNLKHKITQWKKEIQPYNQHPMKLKAKSSALLVIDMQRFFLNPKSPTFTCGGLAILPNIKSLIQIFRKKKLPVIYTAHVHKSSQMDGGIMSWWWEGILIEGTPQAQVHPSIAPLTKEKIVYKHRYSAFYNTDLETTLRCLKITDLVVSGIMSNLCVESTVRDAYFRDYRVHFLLDATGTINEELHLATLKNVAFGFAHVTETEKIIRQLG
ncbi:MAG: isochorismatase family protein [candidate division Zixibacteria bacterium]|nr:isochorismatase family protein [candidate division Zixibacteria bacterium]